MRQVCLGQHGPALLSQLDHVLGLCMPAPRTIESAINAEVRCVLSGGKSTCHLTPATPDPPSDEKSRKSSSQGQSHACRVNETGLISFKLSPTSCKLAAIRNQELAWHQATNTFMAQEHAGVQTVDVPALSFSLRRARAQQESRGASRGPRKEPPWQRWGCGCAARRQTDGSPPLRIHAIQSRPLVAC